MSICVWKRPLGCCNYVSFHLKQRLDLRTAGCPTVCGCLETAAFYFISICRLKTATERSGTGCRMACDCAVKAARLRHPCQLPLKKALGWPTTGCRTVCDCEVTVARLLQPSKLPLERAPWVANNRVLEQFVRVQLRSYGCCSALIFTPLGVGWTAKIPRKVCVCVCAGSDDRSVAAVICKLSLSTAPGWPGARCRFVCGNGRCCNYVSFHLKQ